MFLLVVVFACLIPSFVNAASDEFSYNITSGKATVTCAFKFVYKLGGSRIDLRRSTAECSDLPRTIKVKDYDVSSECGSIFTISMTATKKETTLTAGTVTPSKGCKPTAPPPTTTMKPKPKRKCPYGTTYICPSFQDGSCLPKQVSVCFKEGKMGMEEPTEEMPIEMTTETSRAGEVEAYKPSKEEKEDVIAACMCMPNLALYAGALKVIPPVKKPGKGKGKPTEEMPATEVAERELEMEPRATCNEKFSRNFKIGKQLIKCNWVLVYTATTLDLAASKATCKKDSSKPQKGKDVAIKTTCGSVITMNLNVAKKTAITSGTITKVGETCKCYEAPTTAAQTTDATTTDAATTDAATTDTATTDAATTDAATTPTGPPPKGTTSGGGKGTTSGGGKGKGTTSGGGKGKGTTSGGGKGKGTTSGGGKGKGTTSGGGQGNGAGQGNGGSYSPLKSVFSPRFMNECACIEQGAMKKGKQ